MRILLVEDEHLIARFVSRGLRAEGYTTSIAADGHEAVEHLANEPCDLMILDLLLPGLDGLAVLRHAVSQNPELPVLVLSARTGVATKVEALDAGARDYLAKPFALDELLARVRVLLRAGAGPSRQGSTGAPALELDGRTRSISGRDGRVVHLSEREYALLEYLVRSRDEVVSRERILNAVWDYQFDPRSNVVDVYVARLRRKLESEAVIETVRGGGYRLVPC